MELIPSSAQEGWDSIPWLCLLRAGKGGRSAKHPAAGAGWGQPPLPSRGKGPGAAGDPTFRLREGLFCLKRKSQTSRVPSDLVVKKTAGLTVLQHPSVR